MATVRVPALGTLLALLVLAAAVCPPAAVAEPPATPPPGSAAPTTTAASPSTQRACPERPIVQPDAAPVLAHFYIWFNASSWNRAKRDFPSVGRYSSDQVSVMRKQVVQARSAGIDGFIVSWKSSELLNARLAALREVAASENFKLAITYQAQDFNRAALPAAQVQHDLEELAARYGNDPVFQVLGPHPVVAISGTWNYSEDELRAITAPVADRLTVLATEKNLKGYDRVAPMVDGELYYWSSADPQANGRYREKLLAMANDVRAHCGIWVAPVAPGFDARDIGGHSVVDRRNGETLRSSWQGALATVPDMIGVISWNEFSENTYIEPSKTFGTRYLDVLRELTGAPPPPEKETDSSDPQAPGSAARGVLSASVVLGFLLLVTVTGTWRRRRADRR